MPASSVSWNASLISIVLNRVGASTQPCFTPLDTLKVAEKEPWSRPRASMPSWSDFTTLTNFSGHPSFLSTCQRASRFTVSKAFVRSTKTTYRSWFCSRHWYCWCRNSNNTQTVDESHVRWLMSKCNEQFIQRHWYCWCQNSNNTQTVDESHVRWLKSLVKCNKSFWVILNNLPFPSAVYSLWWCQFWLQ